jgi:ferritin
MVSDRIVKMLNDQIVLEGDSSQVYLAMAVLAQANGWRGTASFMYAQAEEERSHMFKLIHFLVELGATPVVPAIEAPKASYKDIEEVFAVALAHEKKVTASIHKIISESRQTNDYPVITFLQWFVNEQVEEESNVNAVLDLISKAGKVSLFLADKEIGALRSAK